MPIALTCDLHACQHLSSENRSCEQLLQSQQSVVCTSMQLKLAYKMPFDRKTRLRLCRLHNQPLTQSGMLNLCTAATHKQTLHGTMYSCLFMLYMH